MIEEACSKCGKGFTAKSWDERHTADDGTDVHARCCQRLTCKWKRDKRKAKK